MTKVMETYASNCFRWTILFGLGKGLFEIPRRARNETLPASALDAAKLKT
jgi:hypothetical protein